MKRESLLLVVVVALTMACGSERAGYSTSSPDAAAPPEGAFNESPPRPSNPNDRDGDGFLTADDCNDDNASINPGAIEIAGDGIDNDCNGQIDETSPDCDEGLALASDDARDYARSLGLCKEAKDRSWGLIDAVIETTDTVGKPLGRQRAIQSAWGKTIVPRAGKSMVVLSNGVARTPGQPDYVALPKGTDSTSNVNASPSGFPKNAAGCPVSKVKYAMDSVVLRLVLRVPTNAKALSFDFKFYTSEYAEYVCQAYNDSFVTLLDTKAKLDAANDKNISFGDKGDPINVNSAFFQACAPAKAWNGKPFACPLGTAELDGTGFEAIPESLGKLAQNGATDWLRTTAPVVPGEEITVRFMIWNVGDHWLPSTVLVDNWAWKTETIASPTTQPIK
jgi:hypothetical protein